VTSVRISKQTARRIAVRAHRLDSGSGTTGKEAAARTVEHFGYVQIDTIAVVERAHHHTLWSRQPDYEPSMLDELLATDRRVFEYWSHAAAYVPMADYRYYLPKMRAETDKPKNREWMAEHADLVSLVMDRIREEGPLGSADFKDTSGEHAGNWWGWKPAKHALAALWLRGDLMVSSRRNFQRRYDLRERVLPDDVDTEEPEPNELARFFMRRTVANRGVARAERAHWGGQSKARIAQAVAELVDAGELVPVDVEGLEDDAFVAFADSIEDASAAATPPLTLQGMHILSPFDNMTIDRRWMDALFSFDYKIECYVPGPKRVHGYFCLPILWGDRFIGRLDAKADRKAKALLLRKLTFEPEFDGYDAVWPALAEKMRAFAAFNGCESIVVEAVDPTSVHADAQQALTFP
jgi:uncharacterized protein